MADLLALLRRLPRLARALLGRAPLSPDGFYYLAAGRGEPVPDPYALRWLLPTVLGAEAWRWALCSYVSIALIAVFGWLYAGSWLIDTGPQVLAVVLLVMLQGVTRISIRYPVLTDAPAFALALGSAWAIRAGYPAACIPLALLAGATRETAPIFAAAWAWHPAPLLGLVAVGWWRPLRVIARQRAASYRAAPSAPAEPLPPWLTHPIRAALLRRWDVGLDGSLYVRPWGAVIAGLAIPTPQLLVTVALAYAQLFAAQDAIRLYQWAAPVLVLHAVHVIPPGLGWALVAVALTTTKDPRV